MTGTKANRGQRGKYFPLDFLVAYVLCVPLSSPSGTGKKKVTHNKYVNTLSTKYYKAGTFVLGIPTARVPASLTVSEQERAKCSLITLTAIVGAIQAFIFKLFHFLIFI